MLTKSHESEKSKYAILLPGVYQLRVPFNEMMNENVHSRQKYKIREFVVNNQGLSETPAAEVALHNITRNCLHNMKSMKLVILLHFILRKKTHFLILAGIGI